MRTVADTADPFVAPLPEEDIELPEADGQATRLRGVARTDLCACLVAAAYNLVRMTKLLKAA